MSIFRKGIKKLSTLLRVSTSTFQRNNIKEKLTNYLPRNIHFFQAISRDLYQNGKQKKTADMNRSVISSLLFLIVESMWLPRFATGGWAAYTPSCRSLQLDPEGRDWLSAIRKQAPTSFRVGAFTNDTYKDTVGSANSSPIKALPPLLNRENIFLWVIASSHHHI